ncbi:uncharacterized protein [Mytilus edulis]|uniref:uncharacterized protein n=1 Tax=Mytilus edulis TaxID=6550 RepID=UPI0039F0CADD
MCSKCKDKVHSKFKSEKDHRIVDIKEVGKQGMDVHQQGKKVDKIDNKKMSIFGQPKSGVSSSETDVKLTNTKQYQIKMSTINFLAVSLDGLLWIGDGDETEGFHPFTSHTALQKVKLVGDKMKVISSFNMRVYDIAVTPSNDILLATGELGLKQVKAGSNKVIYSTYCEELTNLKRVHVTKDGRVIVGGYAWVDVIDTDGSHLTRYIRDKNNRPIFERNIWSITSTLNGNIFVVQICPNPRVVVLGNGDVINKYTGHPLINCDITFDPETVITTPMDNVIVADNGSNTLHILDNKGHLLTTYKTPEIGIYNPRSLAITMEGNFAVLYIGCDMSNEESSDTGKLYKMNIIGC